jgi:hypothetical protein
VWHFFGWEDITPSDSKIVFTAQTADTQAQLGAATALNLATASGPDNCPAGPSCKSSFVAVDVDPPGTDPNGSWSRAWLRVNMALNPSTDKKSAPTLIAWQQAFNCIAAQ